ncbi:unnamed protein product [Closterium sp. Naga37s-1]|nr:unnamed protein product [Closterium sp. Naga37s-1]
MVPLLICLVCLMGGCMWWLCRRCLHSGSTASKDWPPATYDEFKDVPRICRILLSVYEEDINNPVYNDRLEINDVVRLAGYKDTQGRCPPYVIYVDHAARDICLAVRGLNMANFADYRVLMDNRIGKQRFDGGYVHHGLLKSAAWLLDQEMETLNALAAENPAYTVTLAGHSLGSGIVAMMTVILHKNPDEVGFDNARLRCFCIAPARSTSLNLAIKYADIINSVVLQDDFLPRTSAPIDNILALSFCLPCMLCVKCCWDSCGLYKRRLKDPRRLYAPGRLFHILYTSDFSCQEEEPQVKTAVPVEDRFEKVVLSRTAIDDHSIVIIERRSTVAVESLELREQAEQEEEKKTPPEQQRMKRSSTMKERQQQYAQALERALTLHVPDAASAEEIRQLVAAAEAREEGVSDRAVQGHRADKTGEKGDKGDKGEKVQVKEKSETIAPSPTAAAAAAAAAAGAVAVVAAVGMEGGKEAVGGEKEAERKKDEDETSEKSAKSETLSEFWQKELEEFREKEKQALLEEERKAEERVRQFEEQSRADKAEKAEKRRAEQTGGEEEEEKGEEAESLSDYWSKELAALRRREEVAMVEREAQAAERIRAFEERQRVERARRVEEGEAAERLSEFWGREMDGEKGEGEWAEREVEGDGEGVVGVGGKEGGDGAVSAATAPAAAAAAAAAAFAAAGAAARSPAATAGAPTAGGGGDVVVEVGDGAARGPADVAIQVDEGTAMLPKTPPPATAPAPATASAARAAGAGAKGEKSEAERDGQQHRHAHLGRALTTTPQQQQQQQPRVEAAAARQQMGRAITVGSGREKEAAAAARLSAGGAAARGGLSAGEVGGTGGTLSVRQKWARIVDELIDAGEGEVHGGTRDAAEAQLREAQRIGKEQWHKARAAFLSGVGGLSKKAGMNIEI